MPGGHARSCPKICRMATSLDDVKSSRFWKAVGAEFLGSLFLVFVGCGSCLSWGDQTQPRLVEVALAFGLTVATQAWCLGHVSGAHFNPATSVALLLTRKISLARAIVYVISQSLGAISGAALLLGVVPRGYQGTLCATTVAPELSPAQGTAVEFLVSFVVVLTVFATEDSQRSDHGGSFPLTVGFAVTSCILVSAKYTGAGISPIRSLGPAVVAGVWEHHWVYWVGPVSGAAAAGLIYDNLFTTNASLKKTRGLFLSSHYDSENFEESEKMRIRVTEMEPGALMKAPLATSSP